MVGKDKGTPIAVAGRKRRGEGGSTGDGSDLVDGPVDNGAGVSSVEEELFLRYIDDIIGAASLYHLELENFIDFASNFHPALTFNWTISDSSLPFLDISVSISGDRLVTNIHDKPTDSHSYLDYTSSHPTSCKDSIPFSQFLHLCRICSDEANFDKGVSKMSTFFLNRGFLSS
eukprot:g23791.t1